MEGIHVGNAPCSWGSLEFEGMEGQGVGFAQMLDELRATGYTGTELGDWGYMPTEPAALREELARRDLTLTGAFVPAPLRHADAHAGSVAQALKVAHLLVQAGDPARPPFLVLSDDNGANLSRTRNAGRIAPAQGLRADEWRIFAAGAERVARAVRAATGLRTVFHHHCAGFVETPDEIGTLLELTDPSLLGLVLDTGHYVYGSGQNDGAAVRKALERFDQRIWYVHFKDCHPGVAAEARAREWDYFTAVGRGVFCELGQGCVDFPAVVAWLRARGYTGFVTVEQDVLPGMGAPRESAARNRAYLASLGL